MKVKPKSIPVRYNGERYAVGEEFDIKQEYFDKNLFEEVKKPKSKEK